jgi:rhodanese-related sulfurtransferase
MDHSPEFLDIVNDAKSRIAEVTVDELAAARARGARIIDVREDDEWRAGHVAGAEHIGKGVIERDIVGKVPDKSTELILYCGGGFRSALAADALRKMGYQRPLSLAGGWREYTARKLPVEK